MPPGNNNEFFHKTSKNIGDSLMKVKAMFAENNKKYTGHGLIRQNKKAGYFTPLLEIIATVKV